MPMRPRMLRRLLSLMVVPVLVAGLLITAPQPSWAARGGRIGGGSFRSAPSLPRSGGGGVRGGYGGGFYGGGGIGFPFIIPIFGFGGGGLLGFLVLMAVAGVLINALRGGGSASLPSGGGYSAPVRQGPVSIAQVQVGLLASARDLQSDLRRLAGSADTTSASGLQSVLQETTLALLRHPDLWVYANAEVGEVPFVSAESTFNRLSMQERSKLLGEITVNVSGRTSSAPSPVAAGASDATSDYIAITLLVASRRRLSIRGAGSAEQLRTTLQQLGAVGSDDLLALEVIWQPEGAGEVLSSEELITAYPQLQHL